jgi:hypothetical protein
LREDEALDARACGLLLGGVAAGLVLAVGAGLGYAGFVSSMNSRTLATIASAGLALVFVVPAALVLLATWQILGRTGPALSAAAAGLAGRALSPSLSPAAGLLAFVVALSRADWRVLDLGPFGPPPSRSCWASRTGSSGIARRRQAVLQNRPPDHPPGHRPGGGPLLVAGSRIPRPRPPTPPSAKARSA